MPGALGLTIALETTDRVGETEVGGDRCVFPLKSGGAVIWASKEVSLMRESLRELTVLKMMPEKKI